MRIRSLITLWMLSILLLVLVQQSNDQLYMTTIHHLYQQSSTVLCLAAISQSLFQWIALHWFTSIQPKTNHNESRTTTKTIETNVEQPFVNNTFWIFLSWMLVWPVVVAHAQQLLHNAGHSNWMNSFHSIVSPMVGRVLSRLNFWQSNVQRLVSIHNLALDSLNAMITLLQPVAANHGMHEESQTFEISPTAMHPLNRSVFLVMHDLLTATDQLYTHATNWFPRIRRNELYIRGNNNRNVTYCNQTNTNNNDRRRSKNSSDMNSEDRQESTTSDKDSPRSKITKANESKPSKQ